MSGWTPSTFVDDTTPPALSASFFNTMQAALAAAMYAEREIYSGVYQNQLVYATYGDVRFEAGETSVAASWTYNEADMSDVMSIKLRVRMGTSGGAAATTYVQLIENGFPLANSEVTQSYAGGGSADSMLIQEVTSDALTLTDGAVYVPQIKGIETSFVFNVMLIFERNPAS